jgi:hypothetical protein
VRLRHLLVAAVVALLGWQLAPRAQAAWTLRERATQLADYALCMAGPTAPGLIRTQDPELRQLLRRRLLISPPDATPFAACAPLAQELTGSSSAAAAHRAAASDFAEYGALVAQAGTSARTSLDQLSITTAVLKQLEERAWPFERRGFMRLIQSSSHAKEAPHPVPFPAPLVGHGLPSAGALYKSTWSEQGRWLLAHGHSANLGLFESVDLGQSWRAVALAGEGLASHAGRCTGGESSNGFVFESGGDALLVHSFVGERVAYTARIPGQFGINAASCDTQSSLLILEHPAAAGVERVAVVCPHLGNCGQLPLDPKWLAGAFDVARVSGTTVVVSVEQGVVRARSSRDNGASWTSATIAYDWQNPVNPRTDVRVPSRLLKVGPRLLLHGEGKAGQTYPLLFSDDYGASWHGQADPTPAVRVNAQARGAAALSRR